MEVAVAALPFLGIIALGVGVIWWQVRRRRIMREGLQRLAERDGLRLTTRPGGLDAAQLAGHVAATPRGDRRRGVRHGVEGPAEVTLDGVATRIELACFEWWYEARVQTDKSISYQERTTTVALARLPLAVPGRLVVRPEGILGRVGLARSDQQLESEEFNRRFHVDGSDPQLTVGFLDAAMQHRLLSTAVGRTIHLEGDLLVLGGRPDHRDGSLPGVIGELPAVAQDLVGLVRAVPAQVWRAARAAPDDTGQGGTGRSSTGQGGGR